ncbi:MAG TPA: hypothetical protein VMP08_11355 [Anaerolineae bacterium]|nr:hypothetical protein [Anaerolineae bacterium]
MRSRHGSKMPRLPGFRFEVQAPPPVDVLPRMDVAVFVGFAARGPLHRPVRVEDAAQFGMIFGDDAQLAWDEVRGEAVYAYLAPAVRAFFRNGGRRAWIIRVAAQATANHFPITGLLHADFDDVGNIIALTPAFAQARSEGSWSDALRVSASLLSRTVALMIVSLDPLLFDVTLNTPDDLVAGDLLRITFDEGYVLQCAVKSLAPIVSSPPQRGLYRATCDKAIWFKPSWSQLPTTQTGNASTFTHDAMSTAIPATIPLRTESPITLAWPTSADAPTVTIDLDLAYTSAPQLGSLLRVDLGSDRFWLRVEDVRSTELDASPPFDGVRVAGQGLWWMPTPSVLPASIDLVERLSFELWTRQGQSEAQRLSDLTFDLRHSLCWDALPTDLDLYPEITAVPRQDYASLWKSAASPRFPLAGNETPQALFVPIALPVAPDFYLAPDPQAEDALTRDGLNVFDASLFLDPDLAETGVRDLLNEADTIRYQALTPRALQGLHVALGIEEATLIAVPDAVQRGWFYRGVTKPTDPPPSDPLLRPEWWHYLDCDPPPEIKPIHEPDWSQFLNCDTFSNLIDPPVLSHNEADQLGTFSLFWTQPEPNLIYVLEEATRADFKDAVAIYVGPDDRLTLYGHAAGVFYYRVRGTRLPFSSDWSNGVAINVAPLTRWVLNPVETYSDETLLTVQHAVLRMCAARGDMFAMLALPEHYREDDAIFHAQTLTTGSSGFFGPEEARTLSFGALYHPWLIGREENRSDEFRPDEIRRTPPDGAMTGIIAQRTLSRGAWIAPANEFLKGVVALTPAIDRSRWLNLQDAQLNLIRHEPRGFTAMNSDTLSTAEELRPINVRRLLILLRRLALRLGATYVFEPNSDAFRRSVQRGFESMLDGMFLRGAFAGSTAATSYQVVTDTSVNTPQSVDQGRFIVELRVAPSLPLTFLTIRLVQTGDRTLVTQET